MSKLDTDGICREHSVHFCVVCCCDDMHAWMDGRREKRAQLKREWRETPVHERYDLGGES